MAVSQNAKWLFENKLLRAATVLSTNVSMLLPLANLKTPQRGRAARFDALTDARIAIDFGSAHAVSMVAWAGANFRSGASVSIFRNTANDYGTATLVQGVTHVQATQPIVSGFPIDYVNFALFDPITYRYWWVVCGDSGHPDGHLDMGVLGIGATVELSGNFNDSISVGFVEEGRTEYGLSGTPHADSRPPARTLSIDFSGIPDADLWGQIYRLFGQIGTARDFWFVPFPLATGTEKNELALYGRFTSLPRIQVDGPTTWSPGGITIRESL